MSRFLVSVVYEIEAPTARGAEEIAVRGLTRGINDEPQLITAWIEDVEADDFDDDEDDDIVTP